MPHGPQSFKKAENKKFAWQEFVRSIKPYAFPIIISILLAVGSAVLAIFVPRILGDMTNIAFDSIKNAGDAGIQLDWAALGRRAITIIVLFCISASLNYAQAYILAVVSAKYTRDLRQAILDKISRLPIAYFDKHKYGDVLSRMTNDIEVLDSSLSQEIADVTLSLTTLIGVMIMMLSISVPLSLITFIVIPVSARLIAKSKKITPASW